MESGIKHHYTFCSSLNQHVIPSPYLNQLIKTGIPGITQINLVDLGGWQCG